MKPLSKEMEKMLGKLKPNKSYTAKTPHESMVLNKLVHKNLITRLYLKPKQDFEPYTKDTISKHRNTFKLVKSE